MGADWDYFRYKAKAAMFVPVLGEYNIFGASLWWDRIDGEDEEIPFYKLPSLGQARYSTGYVYDSPGLRGIWENLYADQNRAIFSLQLRHRGRGDWMWDMESEDLKYDIDYERLIENSALQLWAEGGQVWEDGEEPEEIIMSYGIGLVLFFETGFAQEISLGYSNDLQNYLLFTYNQQF